jgi:hypothetical protein
MRSRSLLLLLALAASAPLVGGCARLNQWLEGTAGEEEKKDQEDPAKTFADQKKALAGDDKAKRKDAVGKLVDLATLKPPTVAEDAQVVEQIRPQARALAISLMGDADPEVAKAALAKIAGVTGFAEKTEDERQLDPEAYDRQLTIKRAVLSEGLAHLQAAVAAKDPDLRYGALVVLGNLAKPPLVGGDAKQPEAAQAAAAKAALQPAAPDVGQVVRDATMPTDVRLMAIETLATMNAWTEMGQLEPLLADKDVKLRARVALALAQAGAGLGDKATAETKLTALATDQTQPEEVRWQAILALGSLGSASAERLTEALLPPAPAANSKREHDPSDDAGMAPLEAYRTYALSHSSSATAQQAAAQLSSAVDKAAHKAEDDLAADRKKGYK